MEKILQKPEKIYLHHQDLPKWAMDAIAKLPVKQVAIDTEAMGLNLLRDRLCLIQLCFDGKECHLVKIDANKALFAPNLLSILEDDSFLKLFHFGRFDIAGIFQTFGVLCKNVYCTKIASKLARTYTDRHGLKTICNEMLGIDISKKEQSSDWGKDILTEEQKAYAANDVLYLHLLKEKFDDILERESRKEFALECFKFLPYLAALDCSGWNESIFSHQ